MRPQRRISEYDAAVCIHYESMMSADDKYRINVAIQVLLSSNLGLGKQKMFLIPPNTKYLFG